MMWKKIKDSFHGSEVIFWSRINAVVWLLLIGVQGLDITPLVHDPRYLAGWFVASNVISEVLRRHRAQYDDDGRMK